MERSLDAKLNYFSNVLQLEIPSSLDGAFFEELFWNVCGPFIVDKPLLPSAVGDPVGLIHDIVNFIAANFLNFDLVSLISPNAVITGVSNDINRLLDVFVNLHMCLNEIGNYAGSSNKLTETASTIDLNTKSCRRETNFQRVYTRSVLYSPRTQFMRLRASRRPLPKTLKKPTFSTEQNGTAVNSEATPFLPLQSVSSVDNLTGGVKVGGLVTNSFVGRKHSKVPATKLSHTEIQRMSISSQEQASKSRFENLAVRRAKLVLSDIRRHQVLQKARQRKTVEDLKRRKVSLNLQENQLRALAQTRVAEMWKMAAKQALLDCEKEAHQNFTQKNCETVLRKIERLERQQAHID